MGIINSKSKNLRKMCLLNNREEFDIKIRVIY
jgi:hypothetical protein